MTDVPEPEETPSSEPRAEQGSFQERVSAARGEFEHQVAYAREKFEQRNQRLKQRTGRDLIAAVLIGVAAGAVLLVSLLVVKTLFVLVALLVSVLGVHELWRALRRGGRRVDLAPQLIAVVLLLSAGYFADSWLHAVSLFVSLTIIVVWRLMAQMMAEDGRPHREVLADVVVGAFVPLYVPLLASLALVLLRAEDGEWWVLAFLIVAVVADTAAYASGLAFGKHPMAPRISPKKTWEGFAGAALAAVVAGALLAQFHARDPLVDGTDLRRRDPLHGHRRRPRRVDDQARPRHQGHVLHASRARRSPRPSRQHAAVRRGRARPAPAPHPAGGIVTDSSTDLPFPLTEGRDKGYDRAAVDAFLARARAAFEEQSDDVDAEQVRAAAFPLVRGGYRVASVDAALARVEDAFAARERDQAVRADGAGTWVARVREDAQVVLDRLQRPVGERFDRVGLLRFGYARSEVDLVADRIVAYLAHGDPLSVEQVRQTAFRMTRDGYREEQVDAVLDAVIEVMLAVR